MKYTLWPKSTQVHNVASSRMWKLEDISDGLAEQSKFEKATANPLIKDVENNQTVPFGEAMELHLKN